MNDYNENYINAFDEKTYMNYLSNRDLLKHLTESYLKKYDVDSNAEIMDILIKESLDHYVLYKLITDENFINSKEMHNYMLHFCTIYTKSSMELNTNIVFRNPEIRKKITDTHLRRYKDRLTQSSHRDNDQCKTIIDKIQQGMTITQQELDFVCEYIAKYRLPRFNENEILLNFIFGRMKDTNLRFSYQVQDLILSYIPRFYPGLNNVRIVLADTVQNKKQNGPAFSAGIGEFVFFNKDAFKNVNTHSIDDSNVERLKKGNDISFFTIVAFHELTHQIQRKEAKHKQFYSNSGLSYVVHGILNAELQDYKDNHDSDSMEIDANEKGWQKSWEFFNKFYSGPDKKKLLDNCSRNIYASRARRDFAYKKEKDGKYVPYEIYDINNLTNIIIKKPSYINQFPILSIFYQPNGYLDPYFMTKQVFDDTGTSDEFINFFMKNKGIEALKRNLAQNTRQLSSKEVDNLLDNIFNYILNRLRRKNRLQRIISEQRVGEYNNNEELTPEVAEKLWKQEYNSMVECYEKVKELYQLIEALYPEKISRIEDNTIYLNQKFQTIIGLKGPNL